MKYIPLAAGVILLAIIASIIFIPPAVGWQTQQPPKYSQYNYPGTTVPWTAPKPIIRQSNWATPKPQIRCTSSTYGSTTTTTCK